MLKLAVSSVIAVIPVVVFAEELSDSELAFRATEVQRLIRVTEEPHRMDDSTATLCIAPQSQRRAHNLHEGSLAPAFCHVYVTPQAKDTMQTGRGTYEAGTLVVKSKLKSKESNAPELFTVMRKMEDGYDADHGNWEYSVIDGPTRRLLSRGRIDSCIACHAAYESTDFISRAYIADSKEESSAAEPEAGSGIRIPSPRRSR